MYMQITTIGGAIGLVVIIAALFCYYKFFVPKSADIDAAARFIEGYKGVFTKTIDRIIDTIDCSKYSTIEELESDIFGIAYDECWKYTEKAVQEALDNSAIGRLVAKCLTREVVEDFVRDLISNNFMPCISEKYVARFEESVDEIEAEELRAQREADEYEAGTKVVEEYVEPEEDPEAEANLNPQTDEDDGFEEDDESQEIVGEPSTVDIGETISSEDFPDVTEG